MNRFQWFLLFIFVMASVGFNEQCLAARFAFDASGKPSYGDADWVIDADRFPFRGGQSDPQRYPSPDQCSVRDYTSENYWTGGYSAWGIELVKSGHWVETISRTATLTYGSCSNPQDLSHYDVLILPEPQEPYTETEIEAVEEFVFDGGGLFLISNHCGSDRNGNDYDSARVFEAMNTAGRYGIEFEREPDPPVTPLPCKWNEYNREFTEELSDPIIYGPYGEVTQIKFSAATNIIMHPENNSYVQGHAWRNDEPHGNTMVTVATSQYGDGRIAAIGDSAPADDGTGDERDDLINSWSVGSSTNDILFMNISEWLTSSDQPPLPTRTPCPNSTPWPTCPPTPTPGAPTPSPTGPTPTPTATIPLEPSIRIDVNQVIFRGGDPFILTVEIDNPGPGRAIDLYIVLQVADLFFFYPSWSMEVDSEWIYIGEGTYPSMEIFNFVWPYNAGVIESVTFWAAMLEPGTSNLIGNLTYDIFSAY